MDLESASQVKQGLLAGGWSRVKALAKNFKTKVFDFFSNVKKLGQDDPRRVVHSLKVGLALTLVSLFYYYQPLYDSFGVSAMWAVMTVVVVFEFSVGATLGKGVNRGIATLLAGVLAVGAHKLAILSGRIGEPIVLGFFVFIQAAVSTFARFYPKMKARYDYGLLIFILTFSLISVSGYRDDDLLELAHKRLSTVLIGGSTCVVISILLFPVWAGQDLHNLTASNIEKLAYFLEGFGDEYFKMAEQEGEPKEDKSFLQGYKSVLNSKSNEDALANFARWEPGHGRFQFRHPWKQYQKVGALTRHCAYRIESLSGYLNADIQGKPEIRTRIQETCTKMSLESGKALKELGLAIKTMTKPFGADTHIENSKSAAKNLNSLLKSGLWDDEMDLLEIVPVATVASLLIDVVNCTEEIAESVRELASMANFQGIKTSSVSPEKPKPDQSNSHEAMNCSSVIITIGDGESSSHDQEPQNSSPTMNNTSSSRPSPRTAEV
ncbi:Aluminum-activated malate transporter [Corchorus capsularis]|uniref:Aluminum-activated malate transporter n=1 Tax=Corchorus capsularis TaxID=210143 RepID=A0A1R3GXC2_COCAP|nr:Aluminum-activated malate transporter [Corchorus capsularis]